MTTKTAEYLYIRAWGRYLHSLPYYIEDQVARARSEGASQRAIYKDSDGRWHTIDEAEKTVITTIEGMVRNG